MTIIFNDQLNLKVSLLWIMIYLLTRFSAFFLTLIQVRISCVAGVILFYLLSSSYVQSCNIGLYEIVWKQCLSKQNNFTSLIEAIFAYKCEWYVTDIFFKRNSLLYINNIQKYVIDLLNQWSLTLLYFLIY